MNLIGVSHVFFYVVQLLYPYIISNPTIDYIYLFVELVVYLSWTLFDGQCVVTMIYKKQTKNTPNADFKDKQINSEFKELYLKLIKSEKVGFFLFSLLNIFNIANVLIVLNRRSFKRPFISLVGLCMLVYLYFSYKQIGWINAAFFFIFSGLLYSVFKKWKKMK